MYRFYLNREKMVAISTCLQYNTLKMANYGMEI